MLLWVVHSYIIIHHVNVIAPTPMSSTSHHSWLWHVNRQKVMTIMQSSEPIWLVVEPAVMRVYV